MQPLGGVFVVDLSQNLAGPFCTQILGDLGAEVVKVERPGTGDAARQWGPPFWGDDGALFLSSNRNKRSVAVDLKTTEGREVVERLASRADIFVESFRAGGAERLGLDYRRLSTSNPRLIYCSITAFGVRGPSSHLPGYDPLLQAYGGLMSVTGHADQPPVRVGTSIIDMATGMWAAIGIIAALREREATGRGTHIVASLFDTALMWCAYHAIGYLATGQVPRPHGTGLGMIAPYEAFPTADGRVMIAAGNDELFRRTCHALALPGLARDPRFADNASRVRHRTVLFDLIAEATGRLTTEEVTRRLQGAGVPCAPIRSIDQVLADPQVEANEMLIGAAHPNIPDFRTIALPIQWDGARAPVRRAPPVLGQHTAEVLEAIGYGHDEIAELERIGAIQCTCPVGSW